MAKAKSKKVEIPKILTGNYWYDRHSNPPLYITITKDGRKKDFDVEMKFKSGHVHVEQWTEEDIKQLMIDKLIHKTTSGAEW